MSLETISDALVAARLSNQAVLEFPGDVPGNLSEAYAVQHRSIGIWPDTVIGFKVGGIPTKWRDTYPASWLAGPVFEKGLTRADGDASIEVEVYEGGFAAYEAEIVMEISGWRDMSQPITDTSDALKYVRAAYLGAEISSSPMPMVNALGPGSIISDFGNSTNILLSQVIEKEWLTHLSDLYVKLYIDDKLIGDASPKEGETGPVGALMFLLNHLLTARDEIELPDTLFISTGAITGVHETTHSTQCLIKYEPLGELKIHMVPKAPTESIENV